MINDAINPPLVVARALVSKTCPEIYGFISIRLNCSLPLPGNLGFLLEPRTGQIDSREESFAPLVPRNPRI